MEQYIHPLYSNLLSTSHTSDQTHKAHELGSSSTNGSGSQDPGPMEESRAVTAAGPQSPEAAAGPRDQAVVGPPTSEVSPDAKDW
jgi:hypothetical protein